MSDGKRCENCVFWQWASGKCHRHPPVIVMIPASEDGGLEPVAMFPETNRFDWCGEYSYHDKFSEYFVDRSQAE